MGKRQRGKKEEHKPYPDILLENKNFETYYKQLNIVQESQWPSFLQTLKTPLPTNFRFTGSRSTAQDLKNLMISEFFSSLESVVDKSGTIIPPPTPLPWYPDGLGWQYTAGRSIIRKSPGISKFHRFLVSETEVGNISRQEAVSMIPPLLLDVKPEHAVLDMCAAPGSKTAQLVESLHASSPLPTGFIIANDSDYTRSHLLVRQMKRLSTPSLMVTNHEAQIFPSIYFTPKEVEEAKVLQFDRVLCDVPCSGDGTLRKNKGIWKNWSAGGGNGLHRLQKNILGRGLELLKVGGRLVYSTCSFNPVENEAVIAHILKTHGDSIELLDVSNELPNLRRSPGLTTWNVMGSLKEARIYEKFDDIVDEKERHALAKTCFPPEGVEELGLEKCARILPFAQDTGGFFIAVLKKVGPIGGLDKFSGNSCENLVDEMEVLENDNKKKKDLAEIVTAVEVGEDDEKEEQVIEGPAPKKAKRNPYVAEPSWTGSESPFIFLSRESEKLQNIIDFYGILPDFPGDLCLVRSDVTKNNNNIYFVNRGIKMVMQATNSHKLHIVNSGVKLFSRNDGRSGVAGEYACPFRYNNEGINLITKFISADNKRMVSVTLPEVILLLEESYPMIYKFSKETIEKVEGMGSGSLLFSFDPQGTGLKEKMYFPVWKAKSSVSILMDKINCRALYARLTGKEFLVEKGGEARVGLTRGKDGEKTAGGEARKEVVAGDGGNKEE